MSCVSREPHVVVANVGPSNVTVEEARGEKSAAIALEDAAVGVMPTVAAGSRAIQPELTPGPVPRGA